MICCHICLQSLEFSNEPAVCIPSCGHVFHQPCILRWCEMSEFKTCPKCRVVIHDTNSLVRLYFGISNNTEELNNEIDTLLNESDICRKKIEFMLQEMNKNLKMIDENTREIAAKKRKLITDAENENGSIKLKSLAVLLSRSDELRRIQDYYDSVNN